MLSENALSTYNTPRWKPRYDSFPLFKVQSNPSFQQDPNAKMQERVQDAIQRGR